MVINHIFTLCIWNGMPYIPHSVTFCERLYFIHMNYVLFFGSNWSRAHICARFYSNHTKNTHQISRKSVDFHFFQSNLNIQSTNGGAYLLCALSTCNILIKTSSSHSITSIVYVHQIRWKLRRPFNHPNENLIFGHTATATAIATATATDTATATKLPRYRGKRIHTTRAKYMDELGCPFAWLHSVPITIFRYLHLLCGVWIVSHFRWGNFFFFPFHISSLAQILCVCIAWHTQGKTTPSISGLTFRRSCRNFVSTFSSLQFENWDFILSMNSLFLFLFMLGIMIIAPQTTTRKKRLEFVLIWCIGLWINWVLSWALDLTISNFANSKRNESKLSQFSLFEKHCLSVYTERIFCFLLDKCGWFAEDVCFVLVTLYDIRTRRSGKMARKIQSKICCIQLSKSGQIARKTWSE